MITGNRSPAASGLPVTDHTTAAASVAAMATGLRPMSSASTAPQRRNDGPRLKGCGNGSTHAERISESVGRILIGTRRTWHRSTVKSMQITTAAPGFGTLQLERNEAD